MRSILFFALVPIIIADKAHGMRAVPDDNLAYPVLIALKSGEQGTGFFFNTTTASFLVTARHVLFKEKTDELINAKAEIVSYAKERTNFCQSPGWCFGFANR